MNQVSNDTLARSYDELPYPSKAFTACQPIRMHAIAKLKGLNPPDLATAKVLEIGCSFGGNIMPFAIRYPQSQVVGVDLSEHHIRIGQQVLEYVGIKNTTLIHGDISQIDFQEQFDYIICHGVFSWVPDFVQEAILNVIKNHLSSNGVAYISYNTYPGWKTKDITKDLMRFGSDPNLNQHQRLEQSFAILDMVSQNLESSGRPISKVLADHITDIKEANAYYVAHEYLEEFNKPIYFQDFVKQINNFDLAYLADGNFPVIIRNIHIPAKDQENVYHYFDHNLEKIEQFLDFFHNSTFRGSLITQQGHLSSVHPTYDVNTYLICHDFYNIYLAVLDVKYQPATEDQQATWGLSGHGISLKSTPVSDAFFEFLIQQNQPTKISDIIEHLTQQLGDQQSEFLDLISIVIHMPGIYICFEPDPIQSYDDKPKLNEKYRKLIQYIQENPGYIHPFNRYQQNVNFDFATQHLTKYLDGSRDIDELVEQLLVDHQNDIITLSFNDEQCNQQNINKASLKDFVVRILNSLKVKGFFHHY